MEGPRQDGKFAETLEVRLCARARARAAQSYSEELLKVFGARLRVLPLLLSLPVFPLEILRRFLATCFPSVTKVEARRKETGRTDGVTGGAKDWRRGLARVYFRCNEWNLNGRSLVYDPSFSD